MHRSATWLVALAVGVLAVGCNSDTSDQRDLVTWYQDIAPLVAEHCRTCHTDGGVAYFSMDRYDDAVQFAEEMADKTQAREMPPWGPQVTIDCQPPHGWRNDRRLNNEDIALLRSWVDDGMLEGDPATAAELPPTPDFTLTGANRNLTPTAPYSLEGPFDQLKCFLIDPQLLQDEYVTAVQFTPGNAQIVHHTVAAVVPPSGVAAARALAGPDDRYDCFGSLGVAAKGIGGWVPGMMPFELPEGTGILMEAGSLVIMQIHYHPVEGLVFPDLTTMHLRTTVTPPPRRLGYIGFGNVGGAPILQPGPNDSGGPEFRIPANVDEHTETFVASYEMALSPGTLDRTKRYSIAGVFPHMHYIGAKISATITRTSGNTDDCLLAVPGWNFDWQDRYFYDTDQASLPTIGPGDIVDLRCEYNNTTGNPFVRRALAEQNLSQPVDIYLGEGTLDEMCWLGLYLIQ